ncbi:Rho guanine nucleotide exchange factor 39 [Channa argus]|uniref:Rho guanine nucleotide exchange factor 39 n=1 Tax=Channa argus TaxID=215402 RepID=A0A6G1QR99_CHAAH|nr:Rho guanine nucleotide exchange factor 39 [Channa argus]
MAIIASQPELPLLQLASEVMALDTVTILGLHNLNNRTLTSLVYHGSPCTAFNADVSTRFAVFGSSTRHKNINVLFLEFLNICGQLLEKGKKHQKKLMDLQPRCCGCPVASTWTMITFLRGEHIKSTWRHAPVFTIAAAGAQQPCYVHRGSGRGFVYTRTVSSIPSLWSESRSVVARLYHPNTEIENTCEATDHAKWNLSGIQAYRLSLCSVLHVTVTMSFFPGPRSSIQEQRERWEKKRSITTRELVQTEEHYCQQLELVTTYFVEILKAKGTLRQDVRESIFSSIKDIRSVNQYEHFLQNLIANTSPDHPEFQQLSRAMTMVDEVSQRVQNNTRRHENHLQLCRVQKLLKGKKTKVLAAERWYIREGWLKVVPPKGAEAKPKMFFLFSDMLLQAKRCSPLHPTNGYKFTGQHAYPLQDCTVEKVFGHTKSQGGLLSLTFPKAKLLLMSSNQEDLNEWYQSLSSATRNLQSTQTVVHQRPELCRRPPRAAADSHNTPSSCSNPDRKRNMLTGETSVHIPKPSVERTALATQDGAEDNSNISPVHITCNGFDVVVSS